MMESRSQRFTLLVSALLTLLLTSCTRADLLETRSTISPYSFPADENWDGIDGTWSTFSLQIGTASQTVRVFLSFQSYQTWAIIPQGCASAASVSACADSRGGIFNYTASTTWDYQGIYDLYIEQNLGYDGNALYGYDVVTLAGNGENGLTVTNTTIGGVAVDTFYLGVFGVNPKPTNFTSLNDPFPSYMTQLKDNSKIPSLSFGFTAGAKYRFSSGVYASLTLGGYDTSKYTVNNVTFNFGADNDHEIIVALQSITTPSNITSSPNAVELLPSPVYIEIDSTLPQIWLPVEACQAFEQEFGLVYDNTTELYLVNDTLHASLLARNANITFTVGQLTSGGSTLQIVLPYAAFDQVAKPPYANLVNDTNYFPLRRGANSTQYILGRTFMQEAYLIVDYEVARFQLGQVVWNQQATSNIVRIPPANESQSASTWTSSTYQPDYSTSPTTTTSTSSSGIGIGAIVGIVVGVVVLLAIAILAFFLIRRRKRRSAAAREIADNQSDTGGVFPKAELEGSSPAGFGTTYHEMDEKRLLSSPQPPNSAGTGTSYSPASSSFLHTPVGAEGTASSAYSNSSFAHSPLVEAHSRVIYEMPGDMPDREKDGRQLSEKEALQHRERLYNGIDATLDDQSSSAELGNPRETRHVAPEDVVNAHTGEPLGRHRPFSFESDSPTRETRTNGSDARLELRSPVFPDDDEHNLSSAVEPRTPNFI